MAERVSPIVARWTGLPRAAKWGFFAIVVIGAYFLVVEPTLEMYQREVVRANRELDELKRMQQLEERLEEAQRRIALGVTRYGDAALRMEVDSGPVYNLLDRIFAEYGVTGYTIDSPRREPLEREIVSKIEQVDRDADPQRQVFTVRFTTEPEKVIQVLAALEMAPEITAMSSVTLRRLEPRENERRVEAVLNPEVWYIPRKVERR